MKKIRKIIVLFVSITAMIIPMSVYANSKETTHIEMQPQDKKHDLKSNLDGQVFHIKYKQGYKDSDSKALNSIYMTPCYNEFNDKITGRYEFSTHLVDIIYGYNYINYTFEPIKSYVYNEISGSFIIVNELAPRIITTSTKINIDLDNINDYNIFINKQLVDNNLIKNLTPKTEYNIEIYQKANEYLKEDTLLYETTVKTKSK